MEHLSKITDQNFPIYDYHHDVYTGRLCPSLAIHPAGKPFVTYTFTIGVVDLMNDHTEIENDPKDAYLLSIKLVTRSCVTKLYSLTYRLQLSTSEDTDKLEDRPL